jgi:hypothetical protein
MLKKLRIPGLICWTLRKEELFKQAAAQPSLGRQTSSLL